MIVEISLLIAALYLLFYLFKSKDNLPPGPWGIPFIGSAPLQTVQQCKEMQKKYGNLFMLKVGAKNFLYITDYKLAKEAYFKQEFVNRPELRFLQMFKEEQQEEKTNGIIFSNGTHWHHNRRFLLRHLRDLGMGKSRMEGIIMREVEDLVEDFKSLTEKPSVLIPYSLNICILNIVWQLVSGQRYDFSDKKVKEFMMNITEVQKLFFRVAIPDFFPIVRYVVPEFLLKILTGKEKFDQACLEFIDIVQPFIDDHLAKLDPNNPVDLMDDYLIEMKENKTAEYSHFSLTDLIKITFDLFIAGSDTTANMIRWVLLYMAKFPLIQKKIHEEIDNVVGKDSLPGLEHRDKLAYIDATVNEVQRHSSMISFGVMRSTTSDVMFEGYKIPQNTIIFSIAALTHHDPTYFKNPEEFNPSRFLDANGKFISTCDGFQAFGLGKRQCLGEQFARMELYLIVAALLQNFTFGSPTDQEIELTPDDVPTAQFPKKQELLIKLRN